MATIRKLRKDAEGARGDAPPAAAAAPAPAAEPLPAPESAAAPGTSVGEAEVEAPQSRLSEAEGAEMMVPSAAELQNPSGPAPPGAPALEAAPPPKRKRARVRKPLPPLGAPLAALAFVVAAAALGLEALEYVWGIVLLPLAAFLLGVAALLPAKPKAEVPQEPARLRLVGLTLASVGMLLTVAFVEGLAVFAATGLLFSLSQLAAVFVRSYPVLLMAFVAAGALLRVGAGRWGHVLDVPRGRRTLAGLLAAGALLPGVLVLLAVLPQGEGLVSLTAERAPFVAALSVLAGLGALWAAVLPGFAQMGEWLAREGLRRSRLARNLTLAFGALGLCCALAALPLWFLVAPTAGVPLLGAALLAAMLAGFPSGVARFVPPMSVQDPEAAMQRVKQGLAAMLGAAVLGALLVAAGAAWLALDLGSGDATVGMGLLTAAVVVQGSLALAAPRFPVPAILTARRRSAAYGLSIVALLLTFFGLLLGSGLAQGPGVGPAQGVLLLLLAAAASAGHSFLRVVLVPKQRQPKPAKADKAAEKAPKDAADLKDQLTRSMHFTYAAGLVFTVLMVGAMAAVSLGVVDVEGATGLPDMVLVLVAALVGAPVLGLAVWRFLQARRVEVEIQSRAATEYKRRLTPAEVSRLTILGLSVSASIVLIVFGLLTQFKMIQSLGPFDLTPKYSTDFFVFAILVGLGPYGFMLAREQARMASIDQKFPEFLRDLAESKRAGMTLTQAVITSAKGSYGALTPEIRKMAAQIEWGISFSEALQRFSKRTKTPLIQRSVTLIVQAQEAGGNVVDILNAAAEDAREIQVLLKERKTAMSIYVMIIYISFFVFLSVIGILDAQFLPEVAKAVGGVQGVSIGPIKFGTVDVEGFKQVFFHAAIVQAMGGGFVAGVMEAGKPTAGLRHVFILVIVGYITFRLVLG